MRLRAVVLGCLLAIALAGCGDDIESGVPSEMVAECADWFRADSRIPGGFDSVYDEARAESFLMANAAHPHLRDFGQKSEEVAKLEMHIVIFPKIGQTLTGEPGSNERMNGTVPCFVARTEDGRWGNATQDVNKAMGL